MRYICEYRDSAGLDDMDWTQIEAVELRDVVKGEGPRLVTLVKACWTTESLRIQFQCEDDHHVATMDQRDDPLYDEDVVEVFLDESGTGKSYLEFEISPRNVVFDAFIENDLLGSYQANVAWNAEGLQTTIAHVDDGSLSWTCELSIPFSNFNQPPIMGTEWRWNLYRIDDDKQGERHYWAWSPTGAINYHVPQRFGTLVFAGSK